MHFKRTKIQLYLLVTNLVDDSILIIDYFFKIFRSNLFYNSLSAGNDRKILVIQYYQKFLSTTRYHDSIISICYKCVSQMRPYFTQIYYWNFVIVIPNYYLSEWKWSVFQYISKDADSNALDIWNLENNLRYHSMCTYMQYMYIYNICDNIYECLVFGE